MLAEIWGEAGILAKAGIVIALGTTVFAAAYAARPTERGLALMRPLSLATLFAALCSCSGGFSIILRGIAATGESADLHWADVAQAASETIAALFMSFGCLALAWLCVAIGVRRSN